MLRKSPFFLLQLFKELFGVSSIQKFGIFVFIDFLDDILLLFREISRAVLRSDDLFPALVQGLNELVLNFEYIFHKLFIAVDSLAEKGGKPVKVDEGAILVCLSSATRALT